MRVSAQVQWPASGQRLRRTRNLVQLALSIPHGVVRKPPHVLTGRVRRQGFACNVCGRLWASGAGRHEMREQTQRAGTCRRRSACRQLEGRPRSARGSLLEHVLKLGAQLADLRCKSLALALLVNELLLPQAARAPEPVSPTGAGGRAQRGNTTRARRPRPTRHRATCARARAAGSCRALGPASPLNKRVRYHELNYSQIRLILGPKNTQKPHQNSRTGRVRSSCRYSTELNSFFLTD
jgi:hypothetical protein